MPNGYHFLARLFSALDSRSLPLCKEAIEAIKQIKQSIKDAVLHIVDSDKPLCLTTDASSMAIGAILSQEGRPIAFISKRLTSSQRRWSPAELEGFAMVSVVNNFDTTSLESLSLYFAINTVLCKR